MELVKVGEKTYYIKNPTNIGIYKVDDNNVYIIDSGNDKDAGKKILKIVEEQGWQVKGIIILIQMQIISVETKLFKIELIVPYLPKTLKKLIQNFLY